MVFETGLKCEQLDHLTIGKYINYKLLQLKSNIEEKVYEGGLLIVIYIKRI